MNFLQKGQTLFRFCCFCCFGSGKKCPSKNPIGFTQPKNHHEDDFFSPKKKFFVIRVLSWFVFSHKLINQKTKSGRNFRTKTANSSPQVGPKKIFRESEKKTRKKLPGKHHHLLMASN